MQIHRLPHRHRVKFSKIPIGERRAVDGPWMRTARCSNDFPTRYGSRKEMSVVSQADLLRRQNSSALVGLPFSGLLRWTRLV
jgi:hypothetical protein